MPEGQEEHPVHKISETSKEYKYYQELGSNTQDPLEYAFGYNIFLGREAMSQIPKALKPKFEMTQTRNLGRAREHLTKLIHIPRSRQYLLNFMYRDIADTDKNVDQFLHVLFGRNNPNFNFKTMLTSENLPDEELEKMIIAHIDRFQEGLIYFNREKEIWKMQFQQRVSDKIAHGEYPLTNETLSQRLQ